MDSVLNKLKNKVSSALPGNPVSREYELGKSIGSAGPGSLWKLYTAKKRSTQQDVTVWEFDKKSLESCSKHVKESMLESLKNGAAVLTRIKHPKILSVLQPLEESRDSLAFVTEPLFTSLRSALFPGLSQTVKSYSDDNAFVLKDVEIKYGLMQIAGALSFLHSDCRRVHLNLVPESIVINKSGLWKLAGLEFSKLLQEPPGQSEQPSVTVSTWTPSAFSPSQPVLTFSSPEAVLHGRVTPASDMFSLGLLICSLFNRGIPLFDNENNLAYYKKAIKDIASMFPTKIAALPENLREYVRMMLSFDPEIRPSALQFSRTPYFEDAAMSVLRSVDNIYQLDNLARSQFYKSLPATIQALPKRLCLFRVYSQITEDFSNPHMVPFILPAVLQIMDMVTQDEFVAHMLPRLIPVFSLKEPVQIILVLLQNLHILSAKFPVNEFRLHVLPMLHSALDMDNRAIQELCLTSLPQLSKTIELSVLKNAVLPRIEKLFFRSEILSIRVACLVCIGKLLDHLDKWIVMDDVLPFLQRIRSREPAILMVVLAIYRIAFCHEKLGINCEHLATRILPHLIPLSIESSLNLHQYLAYAELIRDMCTRLEREQRAKLEQLHGVAGDSNLITFNSTLSSEYLSTNSCSDIIDQIMRTYLDASTSGIGQSIMPNGLQSSPKHDTRSEPSRDFPSKSNELTLEQKRKLAAERSQLNRLQDSVTPGESILSSKPENKPKNDLTSSFIGSNLYALDHSVMVRPSTSVFSSPVNHPPFSNMMQTYQPTFRMTTPTTSTPYTQWSAPTPSLQSQVQPYIHPQAARPQAPKTDFRPLTKNEIDELLK